ncbi:MAG: hypothetical protein RL238_1474 [Actinomycetota bacterium]
MLGHRMVQESSGSIETWWTARGDGGPARDLLGTDRLVTDVDVRNSADIARALEQARPTAVVNCAGTVKQRTEVSTAEMIATNALFPHLLADACDAVGARLVHVSTDCVFVGTGGEDRPFGYGIEHTPDATDLYGRSKLLGEVDVAPHLTVRTSMVGLELGGRSGLLSWFLHAPPDVSGYPNATFSGLSTPVLARELLRLTFRPDIVGLHHLTGPAIDKLTLLEMFRDAFRPEVRVGRDERVHVDRRLDGRTLDELLARTPPTWATMIEELAQLHHHEEHTA